MTREFLKNIKSENRLDKIRLIMKNDDVIGGQPTDDENFTSNTPFLDIACTMKFAIDAASTADGKAVAAQNTADAAKLAASNADNKAAGAQTSANAAQTAAATADGKAVAAQNTADAAKLAASNADNKAAGAQTSANTADDKAVAAQKDADAAKLAAANADKKVKPIVEGGTGATTAVNARKNLGLGTSATLDKTENFGTSANLVATQLLVDKLRAELIEATEVPVDQVFQFNTAIPPAVFIELKGQAINKATMPKLFARYGNNLPDMRDRVLRMAGSLAGNAGTTQEDAMQELKGSLGNLVRVDPEALLDNGVFKQHGKGLGAPAGVGSYAQGSTFDASLVARTSTETRVKSQIVIFCHKIQ